MKESQMGVNPDSPKQQSAFHDNSPTANELIQKAGALTPEEAKQSALEEEKEIEEKRIRSFSTSISPEERKRLKEAGEETLKNLQVPLNRRAPESFYKDPGKRD